MTPGDAAALPIAIIALIVSVLAAGFTGWEAVTAHLARTGQPPAAWAVSYNESGKWVLHNVGGSVATSVTLGLDHPLARESGNEDSYRVANIDQPIAAGGSVIVPWRRRTVDPRKRFFPSEDAARRWRPLDAHDDASEARYATDSEALVTWRDYKGRERSGKVKLR